MQQRGKMPEERFCNRLSAVIAALAIAGTATAFAADAGLEGAWIEGFNAKSRLIAGRAGGGLYAGVEIQMPPGWKTYWRFPGESGVPPEFDFSDSENLASSNVKYPAPHRLHDPKAGDAIGYKDSVVFPVAVAPKDASKPVILRGKIAYGVCKELCVPVEAELELTIPPGAQPSPQLAEILARVPSDATARDGNPTLKSWRIAKEGGKPALLLDIAAKSSATVDAFVVPPAGLYLGLPKRLADETGNARFSVDLTDGVDIKDLNGKSVDVVVVDGEGQSQTTIKLE